MKAIFTRYIGPTEYKGSRVVASDHDGNRVVIPYRDHDKDPHHVAAVALCRKMGWFGRLAVGGDAKAGNVYVFCDEPRAEYIEVTP